MIVKIILLGVIVILNQHFILCWTKCVGTKATDRDCDNVIEDDTFIIAGMFDINSGDPQQSVTNKMVAVEAMRYAVDQANLRVGGRPLFAYKIYETCGQQTSSCTMESCVDLLLDNGGASTMSCLCEDPNHPLSRTLGIVGAGSSSNSILVHRIIGYNRIALISYHATSVILSDKKTYPHFYRTIPPDNFQAHFITSVINKLNWSYVSLLNGDDDYGRTGAETVKSYFAPHICVSVTGVLNEIYDEQKYSAIVDALAQEKKSKVIVVWGWFDIIRRLLELAHEKELNDRVWLFSEAVSFEPWFIEFQRKFRGVLLFVSPFSGVNRKFQDYFMNIKYKESKRFPWLKNIFLKNHVTEDNARIRDLEFESNQFNLAGYVEKAVNVLVKAFLKFNQTDIGNRTKFNAIIKSTVFKDLGLNDSFSFDEEHNPKVATYKLHTISGEHFHDVARWSSEQGFDYFNSTLNVTSVCSSECPPGMSAVIDVDTPCCWECITCDQFSVKADTGNQECTKCNRTQNYPNADRTTCVKLQKKFWHFRNKDPLNISVVLAFSMFGVLSALFVVLTFAYKKTTPVVKSSNYKMSLVQLTAHIVVFLFPWLMLGEDTEWKCYLRTYFIGCMVIITITIPLIKVTQLVVIFALRHRRTAEEKRRQSFNEAMIFLGIFIVYMAMIVVIETSSPIAIVEIVDTEMFSLRKCCPVRNYLVGHITCVFIILLLCAVQSFRGRKLPGKYNESKYIGFAMFSSTLVKIVSIPLANSIDDCSDQYNVMLCLVMFISNYLKLAILFGYKILVIWVWPQENTIQEFRKVSFQTNLRLARNSTSTIDLGVMNPTFDRRIIDKQPIVTYESPSVSLQNTPIYERRGSVSIGSARNYRRKTGLDNAAFDPNELQMQIRTLSIVKEREEGMTFSDDVFSTLALSTNVVMPK